MDAMFRFIDRLQAQKGQLLLAFFSWLLCGSAWGQVSAFVQADHNSSSGLATANHWLAKGLTPHSPVEWVHYRVDAGVGYEHAPWKISLAQTRQGYLLGNSSAMFLAAQNEAKHTLDLSTPGTFPLQAEVWTLKATTLAASFKHSLSSDLSVELKPYVMNIHDYEHSKGQFTLVNQGGNSQVTGTLARTGMRDYGFLIHDQPDAGWGAGLNLRSDWQTHWGSTQLKVENLFNRLNFQTIHQSTRQYNVTATGGQLNIGALPSVTGQYGYTSLQEHLPMTWLLSFQPVAIRGLTTAITGQDAQARWALGYEGRNTYGRLWLRTVAAHNWSIGVDWDIHPHWRAGIGATTDQNLKTPTVSSFYLAGYW
ncbi:hypothetical protein [Limnohabitans sp. T6-5]|uniref:hypothetical protein n=1 Tax=Limnohabitans sp. T6-5 TaxID=1100724 RepID=UPI0011B28B1C|nr:hypothetical protein [Limnohabitans sp. T6-5]